MKYYSDVLNRPFATVDELKNAEKVYNDRIAADKKKKDEQKERLAEVEAAFDAAYKLRAAYIKDYGTYSYEYLSPLFELFNL